MRFQNFIMPLLYLQRRKIFILITRLKYFEKARVRARERESERERERERERVYFCISPLFFMFAHFLIECFLGLYYRFYIRFFCLYRMPFKQAIAFLVCTIPLISLLSVPDVWKNIRSYLYARRCASKILRYSRSDSSNEPRMSFEPVYRYFVSFVSCLSQILIFHILLLIS